MAWEHPFLLLVGASVSSALVEVRRNRLSVEALVSSALVAALHWKALVVEVPKWLAYDDRELSVSSDDREFVNSTNYDDLERLGSTNYDDLEPEVSMNYDGRGRYLIHVSLTTWN